MKKILLICINALLLLSCTKGEGPENSTVVSRDYIDVVPNMQLLGDGQVTNLQISASCPWTISVSANWLSVTPTSGTGSQTVTVSVGKNPTGAERSTTLNIHGGSAPARSVVVTQLKGSEEPVPKTLSVSISNMNFTAHVESKPFTISSNTNWTISVPDWCVLSITSGSDSREVTVTVKENPNTDRRTGSIIVSGEGVNAATIALAQDGKDLNNSEVPKPGDNVPPQ